MPQKSGGSVSKLLLAKLSVGGSAATRTMTTAAGLLHPASDAESWMWITLTWLETRDTTGRKNGCTGGYSAAGGRRNARIAKNGLAIIAAAIRFRFDPFNDEFKKEK